MKIRNKKTGEIREVSEFELNQYGLGSNDKGEVVNPNNPIQLKEIFIKPELSFEQNPNYIPEGNIYQMPVMDNLIYEKPVYTKPIIIKNNKSSDKPQVTNNSDNYTKASKYLSRDVLKGATLKASDIANAIEKFKKKTGYDYPLDLLLTQAQQETHFGRELKSEHNYFNVGNDDKGNVVNFASPEESLLNYMGLVYNDYLQKGKKDYHDLLVDKAYVNYAGKRYAKDPLYEKKLRDQSQFINKFLNKKKYGGETIPMFGPGGQNNSIISFIAEKYRPATSDSLLLYNNQLQKNKFYKNNPIYYQSNYPSVTKNKDIPNVIKSLGETRGMFNEETVKEINKKFKTNKSQKELQNRFGKVTDHVYSAGDILDRKSDFMFNPNAPASYISNTILPKNWVYYTSDIVKDSSDVPMYDEIAIKPAAMKTAADWAYMQRTYGTKPPATTSRPPATTSRPPARQTVNTTMGRVTGNVRPNQIKGSQLVMMMNPVRSKENLKKLETVTRPLTIPKVVPHGELIPVTQMKLKQRGNKPVYGPGHTLIGFVGDDMQFYPGEYTGAPNNQLNLQDKYLLDNPELLKEYLKKIDTYKFDNFKVGGENIPMFGPGGFVAKPTASDSLAVMNSQIALNKFYDNEIRKGNLTKNKPKRFDNFNESKWLNDENLSFYRDEIKNREKNKKEGVPNDWDEYYKKYFNLNSSDVSKLEYQGLGKTKSSDANKKYYRDLITPRQNLAAPFALMDTRIKPQYIIDYKPTDGFYPGGAISVYDYDPIAVKPAAMKTAADWAYMKKTYGVKPPATTSRPPARQTINTTQGQITGNVRPNQIKGSQLINVTNPIRPKTNLKKLEMVAPSLDNPKVIPHGELLPITPMQLPQQGTIPFYGPGNTIIGYTDDNRQFYPANQYTGASNNQLNLQDKELLDNPEMLQKYVQSKDNYKFKNGGEMRAKFLKILHDGKVHGKKLTDKQRRFFGAMAFKKYATGGDNFQDKYFSQYKGEIPFEMLANMVHGIPGYNDMPYTPPAEWNKVKSNSQNFPYFPDNNTDPKRVVKTIYTNPPTYVLADGTEVIGKEMSKSNPVMFGQENNQGPLTTEELAKLKQMSVDYKKQYNQNDWLKNAIAQFTVNPRMVTMQNDSFIGPPEYPEAAQIMADQRMGNTKNNSFIGPPEYPSSEPVQQDGEWVFTPVRVDYNKKYVPLPKNKSTQKTTAAATKTTAPVKSKASSNIKTMTSPVATAPVTTAPATTKTTATPQQKQFLPKKRVYDDIWNNPSSSDYPINSNKPGYLPKYQDGGMNEGSELDLTIEEIQNLISKGYKIEII
jgi:hypothetical protein